MGGAATSTRVVLAVTLALLVLAGVVGRLWYVHDRTWEWSVVASAIPPKVQFADRTYLRGSDEVAPAQAVDVGRTLGGGVILSNAWPAVNVPTVIWVRDATRTTAYSLSGGP